MFDIIREMSSFTVNQNYFLTYGSYEFIKAGMNTS